VTRSDREDAEWGGAIRRKLGIARGHLSGLAQDLAETGGWEETVKEIEQTMRDTADPSPPRHSGINNERDTMKQKITETHEIDMIGNPAGGATTSNGIAITWQNGPLGRGAEREEPNGAFVEGVLQAAIGRLQFYQTASGGKFTCRENAIALTKIEEALMWLEKRTADREARRVEGTHTP
jgi:hypothetical protein